MLQEDESCLSDGDNWNASAPRGGRSPGRDRTYCLALLLPETWSIPASFPRGWQDVTRAPQEDCSEPKGGIVMNDKLKYALRKICLE